MRRRISLLLTALLVVALVSGCQTTRKSSKKDTLIVAVDREPASLNPHGSNDAGTSFIINLIYQNLVAFDNDMNLVPELATSWEQIDETTIRFHLRDDVDFHNGEHFTAQDVKYTLEQASQSSHAVGILGVVDPEATTVVSDYVVDVVLKAPFGPILNHLAHSTAAIVNRKAIEEGGDNYNDNPVGTGPFMCKSWTTGDSIELVAFDGYWGEKPEFENLLIRYIPEATTRAIEVETGGVDIARAIAVNDAKNLKDSPDVNVISGNILNTSYLSFNCSKEPFNNPKVRQAISCAVDTEAIVKNVTFDMGEQAKSVMAPNVFGYCEVGRVWDYNVERAKELLAEAGYPNGFKTSLVVNAVNASTTAEMIQNMLGQIGIEVEILAYDFSNWLDSIVNGKQDMYVGGWTAGTGDADYALRLPFHSANMGSGGNRSFYSNPTVDQLLEEAQVEMDQDRRLELYSEVQEILAQEAVYVNLQVGQVHVATGKHVKGLEPHPSQDLDLWTVYFDKWVSVE